MVPLTNEGKKYIVSKMSVTYAKKINADHRIYQKVRDDLPIIPENIEELRMIFAI